jgi:hypothetical protein
MITERLPETFSDIVPAIFNVVFWLRKVEVQANRVLSKIISESKKGIYSST